MSDNTEVETEIIHAAYADRVKDAFTVFAENLSVGQGEKSCKERFLRSLLMVKKARDLALEVVNGAGVVEPQEIAPKEVAVDPLSAADRAMIEAAVGGTTGVAKPVLREPLRTR